MTPRATGYYNDLESIITVLKSDPGLKANVSAEDMDKGIISSRMLNELLATIIDKKNFNADKVITPEELMKISDLIQGDPALYSLFDKSHGDDESELEYGFHYLQHDGALLTFQGRNAVNTVIDGIYHYGYMYSDGRFVNEDGNANETAADLAGWLNYFLNGQTRVFGTDEDDDLGTGEYSKSIAAAASEYFDAGSGDDSIWAGDGNDIVMAGSGDDQSGGGKGADTMIGGTGTDQLWGDAGADKIDGGDDDDSLGGGAGSDSIDGGLGNDKLGGDVGNDKLHGDNGDDSLNGGMGNDTMWGDAGDDDLWGDMGDDTMDGGDGDDSMGGADGNDTMTGGEGNDDMGGDGGNDLVSGEAGNDTLHGGDGKDTLLAGGGNDDLNGGNGVDRLIGGGGADFYGMWDSDGSVDVIVINGGDSGRTRTSIDSVEGFESGEDRIDLSSLGSGMTFEDLDYAGGHGSVYHDGHYLRIDTDGDRATDMIIEFKWVEALTADDFIFA